MKKNISLIILMLILVLSITGCINKNSYKEPFKHSSFMFDTITTITIYSADTDKSLNEIISNVNDICKNLENKLSRTIQNSDVYNINVSKGEPVEVSEETAELINLSKKYYEISNGAFDITTAPLSDIWNFKDEHKIPPSKYEIESILPNVGMDYIQINGNVVTKTNPNTQIDLGGIAKGYIADIVAKYLISENIKSAIIDFGGNILTIGSKIDNKPFNIGIQKPFSKTNEILGIVKSKNSTVVTSGIYQRYFEYDGEIYHHIIDPKTGSPSKNGILSATIEYSKSADADALSTACLILGEKDGIKLIENIEGASVIFVKNDGSIIKSKNSSFE